LEVHVARQPKVNPSIQKSAAQSSATPAASASVEIKVTEEQIERRAHEIYLARGGEHGHDQEDWLQAERELKLGKQ
jgi:hypothetical protein